MNENILVLKSINDLLEHEFFIPSYQRGYRWTTLQVEQLLNDIWEFTKKDKDKKEFYCLQPVVVKQHLGKDKVWEVIDGQQRLTTIRIILSYLVKNHLHRPLKEAFKKSEFSITYDTRPQSEGFLANIVESTENIDYYHMWKAYDKTAQWFKDKDYNDCNDFLSTLLAKDDDKTPVKVIWYEIKEEADSYDIFTRLNIGKIQLTNAELIKALFLKRWNKDEAIDKLRLKQIQIASEWDRIENTLQNDAFWFFIYNKVDEYKPKYANRIEYFFDLMQHKQEGEEDKFTFNKFNEDIEKSKDKNGIPDTEAIWLKVKKYFLTFEEWYNDRQLYHLIGFLIAANYKIENIITPKKKDKILEIKTKTKFKEFLIDAIKQTINCKSSDLSELKYPNPQIKLILLLFNIQTIIANDKSNMRFPFNLYKNPKTGWDVEHIRSQTDKPLTSKNDKYNWSIGILKYFTGCEFKDNKDEFIENIKESKYNESEDTELIRKLDELIDFILQEKMDDDKFAINLKYFAVLFKENNEPSKNEIANLALLDSATNRSYKNAFFPIKRGIIIENDKNGTFIPICTKNVFMKAYSKNFDELMYWNKHDSDSYFEAMKDTLKLFFTD